MSSNSKGHRRLFDGDQCQGIAEGDFLRSDPEGYEEHMVLKEMFGS
jgi:hypothetical protein